MTMYGTRSLWESQEHLSKEGPCAAAVVEGSVSRWNPMTHAQIYSWRYDPRELSTSAAAPMRDERRAAMPYAWTIRMIRILGMNYKCMYCEQCMPDTRWAHNCAP